jgi:hypothetical protein
MPEEPKFNRGTVLHEAHQIINGERQDTNGNPEDSFQTIADYWSVYLQKYVKQIIQTGKVDLCAKDTAMMMTLFKTAREQHQEKRDNIRDLAGYAGIASDMKYTAYEAFNG